MLDQRVALSPVSPTPVQPMDRLGGALGLEPGRLWVKRDDLTGLGGGGNKVRKLEYLCADALAQGCDVLVTGGGRQSNHVRMTAAAANHLGLDCTIVLGSDPVDVATGNVVLDQLLGPEIVWAGPLEYYALEAAIEADRRPAARRRPPAVRDAAGRRVDDRSARLRASRLGAPRPAPGHHARSRRPTAPAAPTPAWSRVGATTPRCSASTWALDPTSTTSVPREAAAAARAGRSAGTDGHVRDRPRPLRRRLRRPDRAAVARPSTCAPRLEGLLLDPVYSGKGMAGLIAAIRDGPRSPRRHDRVPPHRRAPGAPHPSLHGLGGRVAVMHDPAEIRATVDAYVALRAPHRGGRGDLARPGRLLHRRRRLHRPGLGPHPGHRGDPRLPRRQHARARGLALPAAPRPPSRATTS